MFAEGQLLRFDPFLFKNGAPSKPKFYVVLKHMDSTSSPELGEVDLMMASLPTSQDHVLRTYVYGEQVDEYSQSYLDAMGSTVEDLGVMPVERLDALRQCLKQSPLIKRKYLKML